MTEEKHFDDWNKLAKSLHENGEKFPFRERDLWWYAAGENIGTEINGKGERFARPILIVRKYGEASFFGVPLALNCIMVYGIQDSSTKAKPNALFYLKLAHIASTGYTPG